MLHIVNDGNQGGHLVQPCHAHDDDYVYDNREGYPSWKETMLRHMEVYTFMIKRH